MSRIRVTTSPDRERRLAILLIEDNPGDARLAKEAFTETEAPGELHVVSRGDEALDYVHQRGKYSDKRKPDFILLDWHLPNTSGEEVLTELKGDPNLKHIPVIVITGSQSDVVVEDSYANFANACLPKPNDSEELMDLVRVITEFWLESARLPDPGEDFGTGNH